MIVIENDQTLNLDGQLAEKMITRQEIPGLLYWVTMETQGDITFWYQITGLQSLADWLQHHSLDFSLIGQIMTGLIALQQDLPRYYLKCEHLLLQQEQIFIKPGGEGVVFCYEPLWTKEPMESLGSLLEGLLPYIDHNDKDAVRLGYGLYEKCQEENADIWEYLLNQQFGRNQNFADEESDILGDSWNEPESFHTETRIESRMQPETAEKYIDDHVEEDIEEHRPFAKNIVGKLADLQTFIPKKRNKKEESLASYYFEPEEDDREPEHPTVLLGKNEEAQGKLVYRGNGIEENMLIQTDSFLVGGRNRQADASLQASGISRNHARITRDNQNYYVEDLNSRNGTYLNGELLAYKQKYQIRPGDRLQFAREEYVFY